MSQTLDDLRLARRQIKKNYKKGEWVRRNAKGKVCGVCACGALAVGAGDGESNTAVLDLVDGTDSTNRRFTRLVNAVHAALPVAHQAVTYSGEPLKRSSKALAISDYHEHGGTRKRTFALFDKAVRLLTKKNKPK